MKKENPSTLTQYFSTRAFCVNSRQTRMILSGSKLIVIMEESIVMRNKGTTLWRPILLLQQIRHKRFSSVDRIKMFVSLLRNLLICWANMYLNNILLGPTLVINAVFTWTLLMNHMNSCHEGNTYYCDKCDYSTSLIAQQWQHNCTEDQQNEDQCNTLSQGKDCLYGTTRAGRTFFPVVELCTCGHASIAAS